MKKCFIFIGLVFIFFTACGGGSEDSVQDTTAPLDVVPTDTGADVSPDLAPELPGADTPPELLVDTLNPPVPWGPGSRGWLTQRGIIHLHSAWSHDGCSMENGWEGPGTGDPDYECIEQLRIAPCNMGIDFLFMTDHPGHLEDVTYEEGLQYTPDEGDELFSDAQDRPFANRRGCPEGSMVDRFWFFYGTEGSKNMPIGLSKPVPHEAFSVSYEDSTPIEQVHEARDRIHEAGGYLFCNHTEEASISAQRIVDTPLDGMEIYNLHAGLMGAFDSIEPLMALDLFMNPEGPAPDLALLLFLKPLEKNEEKLDFAAPRVHIAAAAATDIHRNVELLPLCTAPDEGMCASLTEQPFLAQYLSTGGPIPLSDGDRVDSYERSFRWFANYTYVTSDDPEEIRQAVGEGRLWMAFDILGLPDGFDFLVTVDDQVLEIGDETPHTGTATAWVRTPLLKKPDWPGALEADYAQAGMTTRLIRMTEDGAEVIGEWEGQGVTASVDFEAPCALRVETRTDAAHMLPFLPGLEHLADTIYPYIYTSPIFLR